MQARDDGEVRRLRPAPTVCVFLPPALFALDTEGLRLGVAREMPVTAVNPGCCAQMWPGGRGWGAGRPLAPAPEGSKSCPSRDSAPCGKALPRPGSWGQGGLCFRVGGLLRHGGWE